MWTTFNSLTFNRYNIFENKNYNDWIKNDEICFDQCKVMIVYFKTDWNNLVYLNIFF